MGFPVYPTLKSKQICLFDRAEGIPSTMHLPSTLVDLPDFVLLFNLRVLLEMASNPRDFLSSILLQISSTFFPITADMMKVYYTALQYFRFHSYSGKSAVTILTRKCAHGKALVSLQRSERFSQGLKLASTQNLLKPLKSCSGFAFLDHSHLNW